MPTVLTDLRGSGGSPALSPRATAPSRLYGRSPLELLPPPQVNTDPQCSWSAVRFSPGCLSEVLGRRGFRVLPVAHPAEALSILRAVPGIRVVVTDAGFRSGDLSGLQLAPSGPHEVERSGRDRLQ
jgi:hypothetical protein